MMARPASSSLQRAVRFNSMLLSGDDLGSNSLEERELDPESDASSQEEDDEGALRHTNNPEYVEFRKVIQTHKMSKSIAEREENQALAPRPLNEEIVMMPPTQQENEMTSPQAAKAMIAALKDLRDRQPATQSRILHLQYLMAMSRIFE